jgi:hypothetical protein
MNVPRSVRDTRSQRRGLLGIGDEAARRGSVSTGFGSFSVPGTRAGAIVSIGLVVVAWLAIPLARPFIAGTAGVGLVVGLFLRWLHGRE